MVEKSNFKLTIMASKILINCGEQAVPIDVCMGDQERGFHYTVAATNLTF